MKNIGRTILTAIRRAGHATQGLGMRSTALKNSIMIFTIFSRSCFISDEVEKNIFPLQIFSFKVSKKMKNGGERPIFYL